MNPGYIQSHYKKTGVFTSSWKTDNAGITTSTQIKLPLESTGSYKFYVDWGDGSSSFITTWNQAETTHTYSTTGTYTVKIRGLVIGWRFNDPNLNTTDSRKILTITRWGCLRLGNNGGYFSGCLNLTCGSITDVLNLKGTTNLSNAFSFCEALTTIGRINEWNTSAVTNMQAMFDSGGTSQTGRGIFNQDIGNWDVSNVTDFSSMFHFAFMFNNGGSDSIKNWNMSSATLTNDMFSRAARFNQPIGNWERIGSTMANVTNMTNMFSSGNASLGFSFNQDIGNWNVGNVTLMTNMFYRSRFNQNIGAWNVSKVTNFNAMFLSSPFNNGSNDSIKDWAIKTTGTVIMSSMFGNTSFNQPLNWNTSAVTDMSNMFSNNPAFNQNLNWNTGAVTTMLGMFQNATSFNGILGASWNTGAVTTMNSMFAGATVFNKALNFNTANVTDMFSMFAGASAFNQNIGSWNVSKVTSFLAMFYYAIAFNNGGSDTIKNWSLKTTGSISMNRMFSNATVFNQPLNWNTSRVTDMSAMFYDAIAFQQNIGSWDIGNVTTFNLIVGPTMYGFMGSKTPTTFPVTYMDNIFNPATGWPSRTAQNNISISFGSANYTYATTNAGLAAMEAVYLWSIITGGGI